MKTLYGTDLQVSALCFGTCPVSLDHTQEDFFHLMDVFAQHGGNFIDTANVYGKWAPWFDNLSEQRVGEWLQSRKQKMVVATKGGHYDLQQPSLSRLSNVEVRRDLEESLHTLQLDCIDLYWLHRDDPSRPIGEILEMLEAFKKEGKLRWYGASNYSAARLREACDYATAHGLTGFCAVSNQWSLAEVNPGTNNNPDPTLVLMGPDELRFHTETKVPCIPYQSTARGWFAKMAAGAPVSEDVSRAFDSPANHAVLQHLMQQAQQSGHSVQSLALADLAEQPFQVIPVTSAGKASQMDTLLEAMDLLEAKPAFS